VKLLNYLADYTDFHFQAEEKLQEEMSYPGFAEHKTQHEEFRRAVEELHAMLEEEEGPTDTFVRALNETVTDWLFRHIKGFDRSVAEYRNMRQNSEIL